VIRVYPDFPIGEEGGWWVCAELHEQWAITSVLTHGFIPLDLEKGLWVKPMESAKKAINEAKRLGELKGWQYAVPPYVRDNLIARARELAHRIARGECHPTSCLVDLYHALLIAGVPKEQLVSVRLRMEREVEA